MNWKRRFGILFALFIAFIFFVTACNSGGEQAEQTSSTAGNGNGEEQGEQEVVKIGVLASLTGALESYGKQTTQGFELGIEYATDGTWEVAGKKIEVIYEDTETLAEVAVEKATKLLEEDQVDFLVGSSSSADTIAVLPLAEEYERIMIVEPAAADSITGSEFNPYIFRTARNSSQDAIAAAQAIAGEGVKIATFARIIPSVGMGLLLLKLLRKN